MATEQTPRALTVVEASERFGSRPIDELHDEAVAVLGELDTALLRARLDGRDPRLPRHIADLVEATHHYLQQYQEQV